MTTVYSDILANNLVTWHLSLEEVSKKTKIVSVKIVKINP
jgi:hypothetical protein